jgi:hypothetical protein
VTGKPGLPGAGGHRTQHQMGRRWTPRIGLTCAVLLFAGGLAALGVTSRTRPAAAGTVWGLAGGYAGVSLADAHRRGVRAVLAEASWAAAETGPGQFDHAYLAQLAAQVRSYRSMGFQVALNYGLEDAPRWLMAVPGARYVNQYGTAYTAEPLPDLIFDTRLRSFAQAYTDVILRLLGPSANLVRVGGGYDGELDYPPPAGGEPANQYWAYGPAAGTRAPAPEWRPCSPGRPGQARAFLGWYLASLVDYQRWQIQTVRRVYAGRIAVLYPSVGFTAAQEHQALSDDLCGGTAVEQTGAFARGWDQAQQVSALSGPGLVVYSTWADNPTAIDELGRLAAAHHLPLAGENGGFDAPAAMRVAVREARAWHLTSFYWVRARQAYCDCNGWATIEDYQHDIAG